MDHERIDRRSYAPSLSSREIEALIKFRSEQDSHPGPL